MKQILWLSMKTKQCNRRFITRTFHRFWCSFLIMISISSSRVIIYTCLSNHTADIRWYLFAALESPSAHSSGVNQHQYRRVLIFRWSYDCRKLVLHPVRNCSSSAEYFVSLQGGGWKRSGSSADWRQRGRWQNRQCCYYSFWPDGALERVWKLLRLFS